VRNGCQIQTPFYSSSPLVIKKMWRTKVFEVKFHVTNNVEQKSGEWKWMRWNFLSSKWMDMGGVATLKWSQFILDTNWLFLLHFHHHFIQFTSWMQENDTKEFLCFCLLCCCNCAFHYLTNFTCFTALLFVLLMIRGELFEKAYLRSIQFWLHQTK
jgi:hypothetical protein